MGSTGFGKADAYNSHLHYELRINGQNVNLVGADGNLIDPQKIIAPIEIAALLEVTITASKTPTPQLPVQEIKIPKTLLVPQQ